MDELSSPAREWYEEAVPVDPETAVEVLTSPVSHLLLKLKGRPPSQGLGAWGFWIDRYLLLNITAQVDQKSTSDLPFEARASPRIVAREGKNFKEVHWFDGDVLNLLCLSHGKTRFLLDPVFREISSTEQRKLVVAGPSPTAEGFEFIAAGEVGQRVSLLVTTEGGKLEGWTASSPEGKLLVKVRARLEGIRLPEPPRMSILELGQPLLNSALTGLRASLTIGFRVSSRGGGWISGLPVGYWYSSWDGLWAAMSALRLGAAESARDELRLLASAQLKGGPSRGMVPDAVELGPLAGDASLSSSGLSTPLWIMALHDYVAWTGDISAVRDLETNLEASISYLTQGDRYHQGLFIGLPEERIAGWPRSQALKRQGPLVEVNSFVAKALMDASEVYFWMGNEKLAQATEEASAILVKNLVENLLATEGITRERLDVSSDGLSPLSIFTAAFYLLPPELGRAVVRRLSQEDFMTGWGLRSASSKDPSYDGSYQTGGVWPDLTALYSIAAYAYDQPELGWSALSHILSLVGRHQPGAISDFYSGEKPEPQGQALSVGAAALTLFALLDGALGLVPSAVGRPSLSPRSPLTADQIRWREEEDGRYHSLHRWSFEGQPRPRRPGL